MSEHVDEDLEAGHQDGLDSELTDEQVAAVDFKLDEQEACKLDASCVRITLVGPNLCPDCGDETKKAVTHAVWFDMWNNGQDMVLMEGCLVCCTEFADRLRDSLPEEKPE